MELVSENLPARPPAAKPADDPPFIVKFVLVQFINGTCLAYQDQANVWREAANHQELFGFVRVLS